MNTFEKWFLKRVMAKEVIQGYDHAKNIESLYVMIREACEEEFTEDNAPTLDAFLRERFEATQFNSNILITNLPNLIPPGPPPGPPNREFRTSLAGQEIETKTSIQRRHDYQMFMYGYNFPSVVPNNDKNKE